MAFSVRERMAFWDFLVPNVRPRVLRAEISLGASISLSDSGGRAMEAFRVLRTMTLRAGTNWSVPRDGS